MEERLRLTRTTCCYVGVLFAIPTGWREWLFMQVNLLLSGHLLALCSGLISRAVSALGSC